MIDINKYKHKSIAIKADSRGVDEMSYYELSRWLCLIEAIEYIGRKCEHIGLPDTDGSWVKPIAIQKYVDERTESMLFEVTNQGTI